MTTPLRYSAFTTTPEGGNPAGVVLDATGLDEPAMLELAADLSYSESAFVVPREERTFTVRYFSPRAEVAFCGHATIATSVALAERIGPGPLRFATQAGDIDIETAKDDRGIVTATLTSIEPTTRSATDEELDAALAALRWSRDDLDSATYPPHVTNAGVNHLLLATKTHARLQDLDYDMDALGALMAERDWTTLQLVFAERPDLFHARNPFPPGGIFEDPATGAAAAALGGYLRELGRAPEPPRIAVLQGAELGRPSRLEVEIPPSDGIRVTGTAVRIPD